ncbi:MAG: flap endonuclease-1 [Candidatus Bathyarchaeota archaeon]|nr:flap endonuclease-1 [Candidatus Bathyarchaeota archaeon]MDH5664268.1 flap endonuclease-1 [Candidatus Bathyarchaeota archaeon]
MGVNLRKLVPKTKVDLKSLSGKSIAIDAYNALYQFLAIIRQPDGTPLKDNTGRITSHLSGLFYRTANLVEMDIKVVYVFDGVPPALKEVEIKRRTKVKAEALIKYERALQEGRIEEARTYAQMTSRLKDYMAEDSKRLLTQMGVPWVQAPSEGEAQAAHLAKKGDTNYCASQDYDSLLFGAPTLLRNVTISGRRKLPRKPVYVEVVPEIIELDQLLKELNVTREQLIDIGILVGTDFNPEGVKGIGPKTALKLIKKHGSIEKLLPTLKEAEFPAEPQRIREIFLNPKVTDNYKLTWKDPNVEGVVDFLCRERDFSEERVRKALQKMTEGLRKAKGKVTLEKWFGA